MNQFFEIIKDTKDLVPLVGGDLLQISLLFISYRFGLRSNFHKLKQEAVFELLKNPNSNLSPIEIAKCKNLLQIAQLAESRRIETGDATIKFSIDWFERFFDAASSVSDEDMQAIWAKILSGEANSNGKYSFRFIESMRLLSKQEAEVFLKLSRLAIKVTDGSLCLFEAESDWIIKIYAKFNVGEEDFLLAQECGLINMNLPLYHQIHPIKGEFHGFYNDLAFVHFCQQKTSYKRPFCFSSYSFTRFGKQLYELIEEESDKKFILSLADSLKGHLRRSIRVSAYSRRLSNDTKLDLDLDCDLLL